jgi:putative ABC transport system permease protein
MVQRIHLSLQLRGDHERLSGDKTDDYFDFKKMIRNYIKIALRNVFRQKAFSVINILGLSIGLACSIVIILYINHESSFDNFHRSPESIYRLTGHADDIKVAITPAPMGPTLESDFSEVKESVRTTSYRNCMFEVNDQKFDETRQIYADSNFFNIFNFTFLKGKSSSALAPNSIIMTDKMATKYFGSEDPIGRVMRMDNSSDLTVTAVIHVPANSHLQPDFIIPMSFIAKTEYDIKNSKWENFNYYTYLRLIESFPAAPENIKDLQARIDEIYKTKVPELKVKFVLQPLLDIHLHSNFMADVPGHGNADYVFALSIIAMFILIVACINFMNLATARSARRAKEVGMRKVSGALRIQLVGQFLSESLIISFVALSISVLLVYLSLPYVNELAGRALSLNILDGNILLTLLGITFVTGILAGSYPALFLSGFVPSKVLKRDVKAGTGGVTFRNVLVITQFVVSIVLLVGTAIVYNQLSFLSNKNLGYSKEDLIYFNMRGEMWDRASELMARLEQERLTQQFSRVSNLPTNLISGTMYLDWDGKDKDKQVIFAHLAIDDRFIDVFQMKLAAGRNFSKDFPADSSNYIINEEAARIMNLTPEAAVGQSFTLWDQRGTIVGVVKDFNFKPLQQKIEPIVLRMAGWGGTVVVRTVQRNTEESIEALEKICKDLNPAYPFSYAFVDQDLSNLYQNEKQLGNLFNVFAILAIFISCLGLYGLSAFVAEQRTKEIGIRKALGASPSSIVMLLSGKFLVPIFIAILVASPLAFYLMNNWLQSFAYHIDFSWTIFPFAGIIALGIGLITVSVECLKASLTNPVNSLRSE